MCAISLRTLRTTSRRVRGLYDIHQRTAASLGAEVLVNLSNTKSMKARILGVKYLRLRYTT